MSTATTSQVILALGTREFLEGFPQLPGDGARFAGTDHAGIAFDDGDNFGGGASQEAFIGNKDIVPGQGDFLHRYVGGVRQLQHGAAGDPFEDAGVDRRSAQRRRS